MFHERFSNFEPSTSQQKYITSITLDQTAADPANVLKPLAGEVDESYTLSLDTAGAATITAASSLGLAHGLTTFTQLFYKHTAGGAYTTLAPVQISDAPQFPHRGLNMDVSRHYFGVVDILRQIDALSYNKMNRLHLHATDSQSWPLEIPALPALAGRGAYGPGLTYTPSQIRQIQQYGSLRGVQVFIETDMPGHTASIHYGYPDLIAAFDVQPNWNMYAAQPPSGTLKLNSSAVYSFLSTMFSDLLPRVAPYSAYYHTGGDEVNLNSYLLDDTVRSNQRSVLQPLMQTFISFLHDQVRAQGLRPMVWQEMLLDWNLTLGSDVVVQTWISSASVVEVVERGYQALVGNYQFWYLDCGHGQWLDFHPNVSAQFWPYVDYCAPRKNWRLIYSYDPLAGVPAHLTHLVLGGEVHMWAEQTDPVNIDRNVWPRASAAAEILWSGGRDAQGSNRSQVEASPRLNEMRERLVARGVQAEPFTQTFCTMGGVRCAL